MKTIAVTGGSGFVGKRLLECDRDTFRLQTIDLRNTSIASIDITSADAIIHLAGKAHQMEPIDDKVYFDINYELTKQLADKAKKSGVKQFVFVSTVKVYGDELPGILDETSACTPTDAYGRSKLKAEQYLQSIETDSFKIAIIRPPLVYGPGVKGNMIRLLRLAAKNIPLPFGKSRNARSMVFVDNLVALINAIILKEAAGIFIAGDRAPLPTDKLLQLIRTHLGNNKGLISVPGVCRNLIKHLKPGLYLRLFGSYVIDNSSTNQKLDFTPPFSTDYGVEQMVKWFKENAYPSAKN